jgi:hypothetical protein
MIPTILEMHSRFCKITILLKFLRNFKNRMFKTMFKNHWNRTLSEFLKTLSIKIDKLLNSKIVKFKIFSKTQRETLLI